MRVWGTALVLCAAACNAVCMSQNTGVSTEWAARWQNLVAEFLRNVPVPGGFSPAGQVPGTPAASAGLPAGGVAGGAVSWASWFPPPVPTLMHDQGGRSMPVLVLPIPVPMNQPTPPQTAQCALSPQPANSFNYDRTFNPVVINAAPAPVTTYSAQGSQPAYQAPFYPAPAPAYTAPAYPSPGPAPTYPTPAPYPNPVPAPSYPAAPAYPTPAYSPLPQYAPVKPDVSVPPPPKRRPSSRLPLPDQRLTSNAPTFPPVADSRVLLEQFRKQELRDSNLLPIVLHNREVQAARQRKTVKCVRRQWKGDVNEAPPPPPRFESSLYMRGRILAHRAGYTEPFSLWWDASSGASRMDFHNGTATTYRMKKRDGRVQSVQVRIDRTGETDVNRCRVMKPRLLTGAERALPALPDLQGFSYAGYVQRGEQRTERWRHTLSGHSGELGGARGEALTFRHELLVRRASDNFTTIPLRYAVKVDSSVLGADCDSYAIYFDEILWRQYDSAMFNLNIEDACDFVEFTERIDVVEPLQEFTMLRRNPRHDEEIALYKRDYRRDYLDKIEEAVRKNLLMQYVRYLESANRQGASLEMEINFLSDRLDVELEELRGAARPTDGDFGEAFPHSPEEIEALKKSLPRRFDWRRRGGVTHVRHQKCEACWAFATVGAVEGALFVETGRLVPLNEQAIIDCAMPGRKCKPWWPSRAYSYIKDRGLPALDEYTPHQNQTLTCRADSVPSVTHISGYVNITNDPTALKVAIMKYGPVVVLMDVSPTTFKGIKKGTVFQDDNCNKEKPNHAMIAVGWEVFRNKDCFILKNSWSSHWADSGFVRVRVSNNTCGMLNMATYPRLRYQDVRRLPTKLPVSP